MRITETAMICIISLLLAASGAATHGQTTDEQRSSPPAPEEPGYLGVVIGDAARDGGVRIVEAISGGPAARAGLRRGDFVTEVDGRRITDANELLDHLRLLPAGEITRLVVFRGDRRLELTVTLGLRPAPSERRFEQFGPLPPAARSAPPSPSTLDDAATMDDHARLLVLERRVEELHARLDELLRIIEAAGLK